jgi:hypothetical protein
VATARRGGAAPSSSAADGTLPPDRRATSSKPRQVAAASATVALGLRQLRLAEASPARELRHLVAQLGGVQLHQHLAAP